MELSKLTETKIIEAAERVFYLKGKAGASMQDIADEAGITRTLLNYYFRSKDKLFEAVFRNAMGRFVPVLAGMLHSDVPLTEYLPRMITTVIDTMIEHPQIPIFVLQELSSNPSRMPQMIVEMGIDHSLAKRKFREDPVFGNLSIDPGQVMINIISVCIFPFAARPVVQTIMFGGDEDAYLEAMKERKKILPEMIMNSLQQMKS